uniref:Ferredoxin n=1 Tax=Protohalopteris sp. TaxID=2843287 RepID=A0A8F0F7N7_9PHAE|nr:ferredoxin [Protohalopteris sp.]
MPIYKVKIVNEEEKIDQIIDCADDQFILEAAEDEGLLLPYSCRAGACSSCAGKVLEGLIDQSAQTFLNDEQQADNFVLTCIAYPQSNCTIQSHMEEEIEF